MDRQIVFAIFFAIGCSLILAAFFFSAPATTESSTYAPNDIRYPIQQAEAKKSKRKVQTPIADPNIDDGSEDTASSDSENEEPTAEEPPLE